MKTSIGSGERYFGVEIAPDGRLVVVERAEGRRLPPAHFPAGAQGAAALVPVPGVEVTMVAKHALQGTAAATAEDHAENLARLAERLF